MLNNLCQHFVACPQSLDGSDFNPALARGGCATVDFNSVKTVQFFHWLN